MIVQPMGHETGQWASNSDLEKKKSEGTNSLPEHCLYKLKTEKKR